MSLKRSPFRRPEFVPAPRAPLTRAVRQGTYSTSGGVAAVPKEPKAKKGKYTPNAVEAKWMAAIVEYGCIACRLDGHHWAPARETAVHHILRGGHRIGHLFTLPLCDPGHHQGGHALGLISRHPWKARFEAKYGTELDLLAKLKAELGVFDKAEYA